MAGAIVSNLGRVKNLIDTLRLQEVGTPNTPPLLPVARESSDSADPPERSPPPLSGVNIANRRKRSQTLHRGHPNKLYTMTQCRFNVGPASTTPAQH